MRWGSSRAKWHGNAVVDVFEGSLLDTLYTAIAAGEGPALANPHTMETWTILRESSTYAEYAYRFDEALEVFDSMTAVDAGRMQKPGRAPSISMIVSFGKGNSRAWRERFVPSQYTPSHPKQGQSSTSVKLPSSSSLTKFPRLTDIKRMAMSFAVEGTRQETTDAGSYLWWHLGHAEFLFSGAGGATFNHNALSYGQKRLLAFLYYLDANPYYVIADELVNGMHHDWIRACLDEIGDRRQAFLTSQNPLLLDYLPLESAEQVERSFIQCRTEVVDDKAQFVWSNLSADDAAELYADYKVGIQHVGELLRVRGLW